MIIGAGIAGLRVGIETLKAHPDTRCTILERYNQVGGRIDTFRTNIRGVGNVQWESGAGRISTAHKKVQGLLKAYKLSFFPISSESSFKERGKPTEPNRFEALIPVFLKPLLLLPSYVLRIHTLREILVKTMGFNYAHHYCSMFPYVSEMQTLRADLALASFQAEMGGSHSFGVCGEGLSTLANKMADEFIKRGGTILFRNKVVAVQKDPRGVRVVCDTGHHVGKACVLALPSQALLHLKGVKTMPVLQKIRMMPLLRIYAVFPVQKGRCWFSNLEKMVTPDKLRYIIPVDPKKGVIMISYTDGADATYWLHGKSEVEIVAKVMDHVRRLLPDVFIPDPLYTKLHAWVHGCSYWLPGDYQVEEESRMSLQPLIRTMPSLFMCSESFAVKQCWIESALEQADALLGLRTYQSVLIKSSK
jgi:monoamine oxidase